MLFQPWSAFNAYELRAWSDFSAYRITCHNSVPSQYVQVVHTKMRQVPLIGVVRTKVAPFFICVYGVLCLFGRGLMRINLVRGPTLIRTSCTH